MSPRDKGVLKNFQRLDSEDRSLLGLFLELTVIAIASREFLLLLYPYVKLVSALPLEDRDKPRWSYFIVSIFVEKEATTFLRLDLMSLQFQKVVHNLLEVLIGNKREQRT